MLEPSDSKVTGKIDVIEQLGEAYLLHVRLADRTLVTAKAAGRRANRRRATRSRFGFEGSLCHVFDENQKALPRIIETAAA